jgi:hypothetical protein
VWLASATALRVTWNSGHGHIVIPPIAQVLARIDGHVHIGEPTVRDRPNWRDLTPVEVDELAHELIQVHGATSESATLLVRARGLTHSEAMRRVGQIEAETCGEAAVDR